MVGPTWTMVNRRRQGTFLNFLVKASCTVHVNKSFFCLFHSAAHLTSSQSYQYIPIVNCIASIIISLEYNSRVVKSLLDKLKAYLTHLDQLRMGLSYFQGFRRLFRCCPWLLDTLRRRSRSGARRQACRGPATLWEAGTGTRCCCWRCKTLQPMCKKQFKILYQCGMTDHSAYLPRKQ